VCLASFIMPYRFKPTYTLPQFAELIGRSPTVARGLLRDLGFPATSRHGRPVIVTAELREKCPSLLASIAMVYNGRGLRELVERAWAEVEVPRGVRRIGSSKGRQPALEHAPGATRGRGRGTASPLEGREGGTVSPLEGREGGTASPREGREGGRAASLEGHERAIAAAVASMLERIRAGQEANEEASAQELARQLGVQQDALLARLREATRPARELSAHLRDYEIESPFEEANATPLLGRMGAVA
jgi:hypothetical protein